MEPAPVAHLPTAAWTPLGERIRTRSLKTLRTEAIYAVAALHQAHEVVATVMAERLIQGPAYGAPEAVLRDLAQLGVEWTRDATTISTALGQLGDVPVPDDTLEGYLAPTPGEIEFIERLINQGEAHTHQALVSEQLSG